LLLLALVALAALSPLHVINSQDISRLCLSRALVHLRVEADTCLSTPMAIDKASRNGHFYSDKAPGLSAAEIPASQAVRLPLPTQWPWEYLSLWLVRVLSVGIAFVAATFMVGRVAEGLAPGFGGVSLVAFGLGTLAMPFGIANFDQVPAAALGFAAFLFAWNRRALIAGLFAGAALLTEYEAALIVLVLAAYVAWQGRWAFLTYIYGVIPGAALLWTYDWLAFGRPWRTSYSYVANALAQQQASGFFGIHPVRLHAVREVFVGSGGLFVISPIVIAAAVGLGLLARRYRLETIVCATVVVLFLALNCGYFLPYGGVSPGPRFLIPALPFLAVGLAPAFGAARRLTLALTIVSVVPMVAVALTWGSTDSVPGTIWGALVQLPLAPRSSSLVASLSANALDWLGISRTAAAVLVAITAASAVAIAATRAGETQSA
jgi:hypothetical protein